MKAATGKKAGSVPVAGGCEAMGENTVNRRRFDNPDEAAWVVGGCVIRRFRADRACDGAHECGHVPGAREGGDPCVRAARHESAGAPVDEGLLIRVLLAASSRPGRHQACGRSEPAVRGRTHVVTRFGAHPVALGAARYLAGVFAIAIVARSVSDYLSPLVPVAGALLVMVVLWLSRTRRS